MFDFQFLIVFHFFDFSLERQQVDCHANFTYFIRNVLHHNTSFYKILHRIYALYSDNYSADFYASIENLQVENCAEYT